ncbi:hypothetical protein RRG08_016005 [Elysia crispata]|uniref:Uncharacterized protein n=1 Tax=Elysia crispata TaxID=231223 RepID=A0AAE1D6V3_9GAST|nr:hypothetical protein RRG08_016005 [Elysia crispata]
MKETKKLVYKPRPLIAHVADLFEAVNPGFRADHNLARTVRRFPASCRMLLITASCRGVLANHSLQAESLTGGMVGG